VFVFVPRILGLELLHDFPARKFHNKPLSKETVISLWWEICVCNTMWRLSARYFCSHKF